MKRAHAAIILMLILSGAAALRLYKLDSVPPGLFIDEASFGYNAYSILKTGMDEFGNRLPLFTPSFGTGKNPVQLYATVASVAAFGLNVWATRFPSVVFGLLSIFFTYLLAAELFNDRRAGLLSALLLSICPWHFHYFSRAGFEPMSMVAFITLGAYLLLLGLRDKRALPAAGAALGVSLYCYAAAFAFVPIIIAGFCAIYKKELKDRAASVAVCLLFVALLAAPHFIPGVKGAEQNRHLAADTVFNSNHDALSAALLRDAHVPGVDFLASHPPLLRAAASVRNYLSTLSPGYLFIHGDISSSRAHVKGFGPLYLAEIPLLLFGVALIIRRRSKPLIFLLLWMLAFPLGACFTSQWVPNCNRTITALPSFSILAGYSLLQLVLRDKISAGSKQLLKTAAAGAVCILILVNSVLFFRAYFTRYPEESALAWQYGFHEAVDYAEANKDRYPNVVVSSNLNYSYIHVLFFTKFDPAGLLRDKPLKPMPGAAAGGLIPPQTGTLGRYHIGPPSVYSSNARILYILPPGEMPGLTTIKTFSIGGSQPYLRIAESSLP